MLHMASTSQLRFTFVTSPRNSAEPVLLVAGLSVTVKGVGEEDIGGEAPLPPDEHAVIRTTARVAPSSLVIDSKTEYPRFEFRVFDAVAPSTRILARRRVVR
jgi:hypothetical protein